jgi:hypothetical protein
LNKKGFCYWDKLVEKAFVLFKRIINSPLVLAIPDLTKLFTIKCDASMEGIAPVFM